jgi:dimethylhistidine N-methyltransferase
MYGEAAQETKPLIQSEFYTSVIDGLSQDQKTLPCRWLYDTKGSELFEQITKLPEYYPTRTEIGILKAFSNDIASAIGHGADLVEFGAGAGTKIRLLLQALSKPNSYIPIDISAEFLAFSMAELTKEFPDLTIEPLVANFMSLDTLKLNNRCINHPVGFFPGSTIGNLSNDEITTFLKTVRAALGDNAKFLIGIDLVKGTDILIPAYDDAAGVTAQFNLNLLVRINRELEGNFNLSAFTHEARWNMGENQIEMHLVSTRKQSVQISNHQFDFGKGETIHTENSRKFHLDDFKTLTANAGWHKPGLIQISIFALPCSIDFMNGSLEFDGPDL